MNLPARALRIVLWPRTEWDAVRAENPPWWRPLLGHVLPLAFLPAVAWAIGRAAGASAPAEGAAPGFLASVSLTVGLSLVSVLLLALAFFLLAPMYDTERNWARAVSVAAYGSTPVLLAGVLLVMPVMVIASMVALLHNFALYYVGLHRVTGCKASAAAEYLALSCLIAAVASGALGAAGGALGVL